MKINSIGRRALACALLLSLSSGVQATSFSYQGYLEDFGRPAEGRYDVRLTPYAASNSVQAVAAPILLQGVTFADGHFAATFPADALPGQLDQAWLQVEVRAAGEGDWWILPKRQAVSPNGGVCPDSWALAGNSGTDPNLDFLGTTDDQPVSLRTRNGRGLLIEPSANFWNGLPLTINFIAGSHGNRVTSGVRGATISGGGVAPGGNDPDISGANRNEVTDHYGVVGGGFNNRAGNAAGNLTDAAHSTVGGGMGNVASGLRSTVGGGENNQATALRATVAGGVSNVASGGASAIPGGSLNCAGGDYSFAAGLAARVRPPSDPGSGSCSGLGSYPGGAGDAGTFIWAGYESGAPIVSSGSNQFIVRATGGVYFGTGAGSISIPAGRLIQTSTGAYLSSGGTWTNSSSRALKENFEAVDPDRALSGVLELPVTRWNYKASPEEGSHIGPMAEDFHRQFGLGADAAHISTVDAAGVAIAAIQGLNRKLEIENAALVARLAQLDAHYQEELKSLRAEQAAGLQVLLDQVAQLHESWAPAIADGGH
jgi:trimeric autotransporter adhesin